MSSRGMIPSGLVLTTGFDKLLELTAAIKLAYDQGVLSERDDLGALLASDRLLFESNGDDIIVTIHGLDGTVGRYVNPGSNNVHDF